MQCIYAKFNNSSIQFYKIKLKARLGETCLEYYEKVIYYNIFYVLSGNICLNKKKTEYLKRTFYDLKIIF